MRTRNHTSDVEGGGIMLESGKGRGSGQKRVTFLKEHGANRAPISPLLRIVSVKI